jgi:hypothetical protein
LGFDVLVGADSRPRVLEVNYRPSLDTHWMEERRMKEDVIRDCMRIGCPLSTVQDVLSENRLRGEGGIRRLLDGLDVVDAVAAEKAAAISRSKFEQIWPRDDEKGLIWAAVIDRARKLGTEPVPGFVIERGEKGKKMDFS